MKSTATQGPRKSASHLANAWEEKDQWSRNFVFDVFEFVGCAFCTPMPKIYSQNDMGGVLTGGHKSIVLPTATPNSPRKRVPSSLTLSAQLVIVTNDCQEQIAEHDSHQDATNEWVASFTTVSKKGICQISSIYRCLSGTP
jgi:hypothetical protein